MEMGTYLPFKKLKKKRNRRDTHEDGVKQVVSSVYALPAYSTSSIIHSQQSFMIITGRRMSGCYTKSCYKIKMNCIVLRRD